MRSTGDGDRVALGRLGRESTEIYTSGGGFMIHFVANEDGGTKSDEACSGCEGFTVMHASKWHDILHRNARIYNWSAANSVCCDIP
jgi:hypothetical protein